MKKKSRVQQLRDQGFDRAQNVPFEKHWQVECSQCLAQVINGVPCHEHGCPNKVRRKTDGEAG